MNFWRSTDGDIIHKFISLKSLIAGIFCQLVLMLYLYDEQANLLVLGISAVGVLVDVWKIQRVMAVGRIYIFGFIPCPVLQQKHIPHAQTDQQDGSEFDTQACKWLSVLLCPIVAGYAGYSAVYDCHKSYYSYVLSCSAALVYTLGFILMTPQLFINYKLKSVAHLPWRRFVYRAINTFIDDLFSFIIRMPTMHRLSCFRDDVVFLVYLWQRQIYPIDKGRTYDEDDDAQSKKQD